MTHKAIAEIDAGSSVESAAGNERYQAHKLIGQGGMALVYEASDRQRGGEHVALKRLQPQADPLKHKRNLELFEREFHTLSQLAHPRIVRVYDFGIDALGAYYAMELLEGGDLQALAPLPWRKVCAIARDVCSALSLLHSRRFVHRDLSPRNVRCSADEAKLIDFGAMAPMGPTKLLVGTPPCCPPESVHLQSVDDRTDLFSLGATLYYVLVGRHAYPARTFAALAEAWRAGAVRPSFFVPDIPPQLDALLLDLLNLEPDARPASAAEVMARLSAIDGAPANDQFLAAHAYLATPTLVGRDVALARVRKRVQRATGGRSRSVVIEGAAGVGRTRFLDACLLDATLTGKTIVRTDSDDASCGDYGVVLSMARQLLALLPQLAREAADSSAERLATLIPELARADASKSASDVQLPRVQLQQALHEWFTELSKRQPFVLAVDDFHRIDEPSAALIALLERDSTEHELCLLITVETGASWTAEAARTLLKPLTTITLDALSAEDSERLLRAVFGSVPHLELLAHRVRDLCAGCPRDLLRLAQHLVDRGIVRYAVGAWTLPSEIDPGDLPASLSDALSARIAVLPAGARELACAFALCPDQSFSFEQCRQLSGAHDAALCIQHLDALMSADLVRRAGDDVRLSQRSWIPLLRATLSGAQTQAIEQRLAELFERRAGQEFRAAQHWFRAGKTSLALDRLVLHAEQSEEYTARGPEIFLRYLLSLPADWFDTFQEGLHACDALQRPRKQRLILIRRMVGVMAMLNTHAEELVEEVFVDLRRDSGYDAWHALDPSMDPQARLITALQVTQSRYDALPEHERVDDPIGAIRGLTRAVVAASGPISLALDVTTLRSLPRLRLFTALSPALAGSNKLLEGVDARCTGRIPLARKIYAELLEILARPDRGGIEESFAVYMELGVMNGVGMIEAGLGLSSCLGWADKLARNPNYEVNATLIRMLERLFQGDVNGAEQQKRLADRLRIQNSGRQMFEGGHLIWEVHAHAMSGDLTRMRHTSESIAPLAKRYPQWVPVLRYAVAEHHRMTRDFPSARTELEKVLSAISAGLHQIWSHAANAYVLVLLELGHTDEALGIAEGYVNDAARELEFVPDALQLSHALARAYAGDAAAATAVDALIARLQTTGVTGLHLGVAHETGARIALQSHDTTAFARHVEACRAVFFAYPNSALVAKYHRLLQEGRRNLATAPERQLSTPDSAAQYGGTRIELALAGCRDEEQRGRLALTLLTRQSGAVAGLLYTGDPEEPRCDAQVGTTSSDPRDLVQQVRAFWKAQLEAPDATETDSQMNDAQLLEWKDAEGRIVRPVLISHYDGQLVITGVAALVVPADGKFVYPVQTATSISQFYGARGMTELMRSAD